MRQRIKHTVTQEEISAALGRFLRQGGMIKKLPAQTVQPTGMVGADKYQAYESLSDLPNLAGAGDQAA